MSEYSGQANDFKLRSLKNDSYQGMPSGMPPESGSNRLQPLERA